LPYFEDIFNVQIVSDKFLVIVYFAM